MGPTRPRPLSGPRLLLVVALLASCACIRQVRVPVVSHRGAAFAVDEPDPADDPPPRALEQSDAGVHHRVQPGETLWRIARTYGVSVEQLQRANALSDPAQLEVGSQVFVPGATRELVVPPAETPQARMEQRPAHRSSPTQIPRAGSNALDPASGGEPLAWPVRGVIISGFGTRDREHHDGLDLACPEGTPVFAAAEGEVLFAGEQRGYGNLVLIRHARGLVTVYAHNSENLVEQGDHVLRGEPIARVGRTGNASGPHLHFEVRVGTRPRDPLGFLR
ncbi:MAG TPA: M23 family metallopeptidase [Myxococcales bacterium]|nr:M23 family metallopeptidase [Myxococcales bacterium]